MKHIKYLSYIVRHKWWVLIACLRRGLIWQGIVHDWSKLLPSEWMPYAHFFYGYKPTDAERSHAMRVIGYDPDPSNESVRARFDRAWLAHQHRNPHHWQHWILREDSGDTFPIEMPRRFAVEMVCDWDGAGRAITGKWDTSSWYFKNRDKIQLHPNTRRLVEELMGFQHSR